jgi:hypothetical protein
MMTSVKSWISENQTLVGKIHHEVCAPHVRKRLTPLLCLKTYLVSAICCRILFERAIFYALYPSIAPVLSVRGQVARSVFEHWLRHEL